MAAVNIGATSAGDDVCVDVVDVGHGSCVVLREDGRTHLIDTGPGGPILEYLRQECINRIDTVVLSHADLDHIGGLAAILGAQIPVGKIIWNGDAIKRSTIWLDLVYEIDALERAEKPIESIDASIGVVIGGPDSRVLVEILGPRTRLRRLGAGSVDAEGAQIGTNAVSVVVKVSVDDEPLILLPGDIDDVGYSHLVSEPAADLQCRYLVLPHHGGLMGSPAMTTKCIADLVRRSRPSLAIVSNGRGKFNNPRADVLNSIRTVLPSIPIACTQLSKQCSPDPTRQNGAAAPYAVGWARGYSCAGTIRLTRGNGIGTPFSRERHAEFVAIKVSSPICVVPSNQTTSARALV